VIRENKCGKFDRLGVVGQFLPTPEMGNERKSKKKWYEKRIVIYFGSYGENKVSIRHPTNMGIK
jgi:hypothetical protein